MYIVEVWVDQSSNTNTTYLLKKIKLWKVPEERVKKHNQKIFEFSYISTCERARMGPPTHISVIQGDSRNVYLLLLVIVIAELPHPGSLRKWKPVV